MAGIRGLASSPQGLPCHEQSTASQEPVTEVALQQHTLLLLEPCSSSSSCARHFMEEDLQRCICQSPGAV